MGERRKKALEKWGRGVEGLIDTPPTVENHGPKEDALEGLLWHVTASSLVLDF